MSVLTQDLLKSFEPSIVDVNDACLLPPDVYTSDEFFSFEKDSIFGHEWLCVGRESQTPNPGDYRVYEIAGEPLIVVRDNAGTIRVLSAVCQHRGMVLAEGNGNCARFRCPYHHWTYSLEGKLAGAPEMENAKGFERADFDLPSLPVEIWQGFVFTNFDPNPEPLAPGLSELEEPLEHYNLPESTTRQGKVIPDLPWNWKIMMENFNDPYHASRLHGPLQSFAPSGMSDFYEWRDDMKHVSRIQHFTQIDGSFNPSKKCMLPVFSQLTEAERKRGMFALIPPTLALAVVPDEIAYFIIKPQSAGLITIDIAYCFEPQSLDNPMFEYWFKAAEAGVDNFNVQDVYADKMVQVGLNSRFGPRGRYSHEEGTLPQFNRWLVDRYRKYWPTN